MKPVRVDQGDLQEETWQDPARGTLRWKMLMSAGVTETESLVCGIALMAPGQTFALHSPPQPEVYFGLGGEGEVLIDGPPHRLGPGVPLFIPGNAVHGVPCVDQTLRWFYTFAADAFTDIPYTFA